MPLLLFFVGTLFVCAIYKDTMCELLMQTSWLNPVVLVLVKDYER